MTITDISYPSSNLWKIPPQEGVIHWNKWSKKKAESERIKCDSHDMKKQVHVKNEVWLLLEINNYM